MPIKTDLNVSPYFDDYDETKNFHRILFRPSTAIQARELTQLQSILQNQIERFGDWAFKNGDIVSGCAIIDIPVMPYVRLDDFQVNGSSLDVTTLIGCTANVSSNLQARVIAVEPGLMGNYPNTDPKYDTNKVYLKYLNSSGSNNQSEFLNTDQITFYKNPLTGNNDIDIIAVVNVYSNTTALTYATGNAHGISVTDGIVFLNGNFVRVEDSTVGIVNNHGTYAANNLVGFTAVESIVTENQDESLFDNALGYSNENAPGAHRLKIVPTLIALDPSTAANTKDFNPIATYNFGSMVSKSTSEGRVYQAIEQALAKRTYEESGNYVVNPFIVDTITYAGGDVASTYGVANGVFARVNPGSGYASGYRVEVLNTTYVDMRRGIDTTVAKDQQITLNYGGSLKLQETAGSFAFDEAQTISLYDTAQQAITKRLFSSLNPTGNVIGTATVRCLDFVSGSPGTNAAIYDLHVYNIKMSNNYSIDRVKSVYYNGTKKGVADIVPKSILTVGPAVYNLGVVGVKDLKDEFGGNNTEYRYREKKSDFMSASGNVTITISTSSVGGIDKLPYGQGIISELSAKEFCLVVTSNVEISSVGGTVTISTSDTKVSGAGTTFNIDFAVGDIIRVGSDTRTITGISTALSMEVDSPFSSGGSNLSYVKRIPAGRMLPISQTLTSSGFIEVHDETSFTIATGLTLDNQVAVDVTFDVLRTNVVPAKKEIRRNRFVKIDTTGNPNGPWCLGFSDVHEVKKVYSYSGGAFTNSTAITGIDVTSNFVFDSGQKDLNYDYGYLYPKPGYNTSSTPSLLVQLDYFLANTAPGVGFFTVESYPIDDANTANTNAIQTKDIPLYFSESATRYPLRDCIDFRPTAIPTANDTGDIDTSNTTQVVAAVSYATTNPSSNVTFDVPAGGMNVPAFSKNFSTDFSYYLARKDLVYITPDNTIKIKEGVSAKVPLEPYCPENSMSLAYIQMPPYPSLSSDQIDVLNVVNKKSKNLARDVSYSITAVPTTNRRYTMKDIGNFDTRIKNLEYYVQLSVLEQATTNMTVTDVNGLDRFKNGIFVEPFSDYSLSDVSNPEYSIALDRQLNVVRPKIVRENIKIEFTKTGSTATNLRPGSTTDTNRCITLPYTEEAFLVQPYATKYRNAALVAFAWNGKLMLLPSYDNAKDVVNTGSVNITIDSATPWEQFANSPFGTTWGDWRTSTKVNQQTRTISIYAGNPTLNMDGKRSITEENLIKAGIWSFLGRVGYTQENFILGEVSVKWGTIGVDMPNNLLDAQNPDEKDAELRKEFP